MPEVSERVTKFFGEFEANLAASDPDTIAALYAESFIFAGPERVQAVRRDDLAKVLPKRQGYFKSLGLRSSRVVGLEEAGVDGQCVLVKATWRMRFGAGDEPGSEVEVSSTYLLRQQPDGLRIVFQLDHDDLARRAGHLTTRTS